MSEDVFDGCLERARELHEQGTTWIEAWSLSWLETRVNYPWPPAWGDDLGILIYGDFKPPEHVIEVPALGITILPEPQENTVIRHAVCVLDARVNIDSKTVPAVIDAARRVNLLLGTLTLVEWGNPAVGWWSWVTHDSGGGLLIKLGDKEFDGPVVGVLRLPPAVRQRVEAALYWIREPRQPLMEGYKEGLFRMYSAYWNAFECLVDAVNSIRPLQKTGRIEKQRLIDDFVAEKGGTLTAGDIQTCYQQIVNPGLVGKATSALRVCFGDQAPRYTEECFTRSEKRERLYDIRNAINHGDVDAENPEEIIRIKARFSRLQIIVLGMFGRLVPFPAPVDPGPDL